MAVRDVIEPLTLHRALLTVLDADVSTATTGIISMSSNELACVVFFLKARAALFLGLPMEFLDGISSASFTLLWQLLGLLQLLGFFVFGLCCFWILQQSQHKRLLVASCFASNKVRTFCNLLQRSAGLVIFLGCQIWDFSLLANFEAQNVGVNHQLFTFCHLFFLQFADLKFCSAEVLKRKTGAVRICVDYKNVNEASPEDEYPMPMANMLVDGAAHNQMLSFMDGNAGYNQIMVAEEDIHKTAFVCPGHIGAFEYTVMPFGLRNARTTYQRAMNSVFHDMIGHSLEVYIDDVVIKSPEKGDHVSNLKKAFLRMRQHKLKMNPKKCVFGVQVELRIQSVEILGDSMLVLKQIAGEYKCLNPSLAVYLVAARNLLAEFREATWEHIPREENFAANEMAQIATGVQMPKHCVQVIEVEAKLVKSTTSQEIITFIEEQIIETFGIPESITTDRGSSFIYGETLDMAETFKFKLLQSTPYYAQANGLAESSNKVIVNIIRKMLEKNPKQWHEKLS
ncbi:hypothetical protein L3X38_036922 [Prunus dulcis]|uniref:Integrase catalytic domain-containing protein n=1 Tax=Prunus dulcis TaxID=3755 RepID=A0AAD4YQ47_PRUDU|nr:hypothetical protein L3X38_036922 [Prunus dulcis]